MSVFRNLMMAGMAETPVYTVTFDYGDIPAQLVLKNKLAAKPADPYKANYNFTGWFANGVLFDFNSPVTGNLALTAGWSLKTYTVTFNANGGNGVASQVVAHGGKATYVTPSRTYYTFTGWTLNGAGFDFNTAVTGNITLVANWQRALITQTGTAVVGILSAASLAGIAGCVVSFPIPFAQINSVVLGSTVVPNTTYDYKKDPIGSGVANYNSWKSNSGFGQTTGFHDVLNNRPTSGVTSGILNWTATGYMV